MSLPILFVMLVAMAIYWYVTQIQPEQRKKRLLRPRLAEGLLETLNEKRHGQGLPILEMDDDLMLVAERKAAHQLLTGRSEEGWEYPSAYAGMFGQSLLLEALFTANREQMAERLVRQRDVLDGEWISCGIGVAGVSSDQIVVALVLCREPWEVAAEPARPSLARRLMLGS